MRLPLLTLSLISTSLLACSSDEPPTPSEVRTSIRQDLAHVLTEGQASTDATATLPTGGAFGFATGVLGSDSTTLRTLAPLARRISDRIAPPVKDRRLGVDGGLGIDTDAIVDQLEQELFTNANYLGNGVYRVPASMVCKTTTYDSTTMMDIISIDPDCAAQLDQAQLRVRVATDGNGIRFYVQIDSNHDEPLSIFLAHDELAVTVNLDDATDAMIAMAQLLGEQAPNASLSGEITGSVHILGAAHARLALSFGRPLSIKFADQGIGLDSDGAFRFTSAAGEIAGVELDANAPKAKLDLGLGETTAHVPADTTDPAIDVDLGGATVNASFQDSTLTLANLSLGTKTTTVSYGGQQAIAIDLNPSDGRSLDATITVDAATGDETLSVSPRLDLQASVDHAVIGDTQPVYDVTRVQIDGSIRGSQLSSQVEVLTGSATLTTNPAQYGFSATAGQCVTQTEVYDDATFQSYSTYTVGSCI